MHCRILSKISVSATSDILNDEELYHMSGIANGNTCITLVTKQPKEYIKKDKAVPVLN
jgi:hypothetical protein